MYTQFFGLQKMPFRLRPEPESPFPSPDYLRTRAKLQKLLEGPARVILLLAPPGVGKTTLLEDILGKLGTQQPICRINQPQMSPSELLEAFMLQAGSPGVEAEGRRSPNFSELVTELHSLSSRLSAPLIAVDDAQALNLGAAYAFTEILTCIPSARLILSARPQNGIAATLAERMLPGEPVHRTSLGPLLPEEIAPYIEFKLAAAGATRPELFSPDALPVIFTHTQGCVRLINVLCDASMRTACLRASGQVGATEVQLALQEPRWAESLARDRPVATAPAFNGGQTTVVAVPPSSSGTHDAAHTGTIPATASNAAELILSHGHRQLSRWSLPTGKLRIGRALDNDLRIEDKAISRHHCTVTTDADSSTIEDLGSVNGLIINGHSVRRHILAHTDRVQIGDHTITYLLQSSSPDR